MTISCGALDGRRVVTMDIRAELENYQAALRRMGTDPAPLAARAEALVSLPEPEFERALRAFDAAADERSYYAPALDCDYGSLLLEALSDACADPRRRRQLYIAAKA